MWIHSWTDGDLGCFLPLTIVNDAAINICVQVFVWTYVSISLAVELLKSLTFLRRARLFSEAAAPLHIPTSIWGFLFFYILVNVYYCLFDSSHPSGSEVVSHCGFNLHFPDGRWFSYVYCLGVYLLWWDIYADLCLFIFDFSKNILKLRYNWHKTLVSGVQHNDSIFVFIDMLQDDHHNNRDFPNSPVV